MKTFAAVLAAGFLGKHTKFDFFHGWKKIENGYENVEQQLLYCNWSKMIQVCCQLLLTLLDFRIEGLHHGMHLELLPEADTFPAILGILLGGRKNGFKPIV